MKNPFLIGKKIYLRGLEENDLCGNYFQWFNDAEVCSSNSHGNFPNTMSNMKSYFNMIQNSDTNLVLAIIDLADETHIGNISLQNIDWKSRNAEYAIIVGEKKYWGKGIAKEASKLIIEHGFNKMGLHRIYCGTFDTNTGMQYLAKSLGMEQEGVRKEAIYKNGHYHDILEYGILKQHYSTL